MEPSHVLVPMDGSPLSEEALEYALGLPNCEITVLNVVTPIGSSLSEGGILKEEEDRQEIAQKRAEKLIDRSRDQAEAADREIETVVETGDPAGTIVEYVETHDVDQVVMGGHGGDQGRIARRLLGTVSTAVVGEAPVTVTVVR